MRATLSISAGGSGAAGGGGGAAAAVASSAKVDLSVDLADTEAGTDLRVTADVSILGKLGTLGHGLIKRRADEIIGQFADAIRQRLECREEHGC